MAERLLQQALPLHRVHSAGLSALVGEPADPTARELMQALDAPIEAHRAQQITAQLVHQHALILVMTQKQVTLLTQQFPEARGRVFRLCHWQNADVADPYQKDRAAFEHALTLIQQGVADWAKRLQT